MSNGVCQSVANLGLECQHLQLSQVCYRPGPLTSGMRVVPFETFQTWYHCHTMCSVFWSDHSHVICLLPSFYYHPRCSNVDAGRAYADRAGNGLTTANRAQGRDQQVFPLSFPFCVFHFVSLWLFGVDQPSVDRCI